jgi:flagellar M-ring protein FliF
MNFWTRIREQLEKLWENFALWQKIVLGAILALCIVAVVLVAYNVRQKPVMDVLYTDLDAADAQAITERLTEMNVQYVLADEGSTVLVPEDRKYQLRLDTADLNLTGVVGFETYDTTRFGETDTDKRVRFLIALQGELARTIEQMAEVQSARVHISMPPQALYKNENRATTASVMLRLYENTSIEPEQVLTLMSFISHSVDGLEPQDVTVMDIAGNRLSDDVNGTSAVSPKVLATYMSYRQERENYIAKQVQTMLERVRGPGRAIVRAAAEMDFDAFSTVEEILGDSAAISENTRVESATGMSESAGENPADANMGGPLYAMPWWGGDSTWDMEERTTNYESGKRVETRTSTPGTLTRLTLSVIIDGELTEDEQQTIYDLVVTAAALNMERGDELTVAGIPFNDDMTQAVDAELDSMREAERWRQWVQIALIVLGLILLLLLIFFAMRRMNAASEAQTQLIAAAELAEGEETPDLDLDLLVESEEEPAIDAEMTPEALEKKALRAQIEKLIQTNPEEVGRVLKTWLFEE